MVRTVFLLFLDTNAQNFQLPTLQRKAYAQKFEFQRLSRAEYFETVDQFNEEKLKSLVSIMQNKIRTAQLTDKKKSKT